MPPRPAPPSVSLSWPDKHLPHPTNPPELVPWERFNSEAPASVLFSADNVDALRYLHQSKRHPRPHLIYIDPPYAMQAAHGVRIDGDDTFAYSDSWTAPAYCQFMFERLALMHALLHDEGFLFVHCDWRASAWLRIMLEELFGHSGGCFRNEVIWRRAPNLGRQARSSQLGRCVDSILIYSKTPGAPFRGEAPARSTPVALTSKGTPRGARWDPRKKAWFTTAPRGDYTDESMKSLARQGRVHVSPSGTQYVKYFLRTGADGTVFKDAPIDTLWDDPGVLPLRYAPKRELAIRYVTQKPESLLERIIRWATREGDLVADFFAGSGTTPAVAERLGRAWIASDSGPLAIHTMRKRMLALGATFDLLAAVPTPTGTASANSVEGKLRVSNIQWPSASPGRQGLRVTRAKTTGAARTASPSIDLIVVRPVTPGARCTFAGQPSDITLPHGTPCDLHIYDKAGRCAHAHLGGSAIKL